MSESYLSLKARAANSIRLEPMRLESAVSHPKFAESGIKAVLPPHSLREIL